MFDDLCIFSSNGTLSVNPFTACIAPITLSITITYTCNLVQSAGNKHFNTNTSENTQKVKRQEAPISQNKGQFCTVNGFSRS